MKIKSWKQWWVVVNEKGDAFHWTLSATRVDAKASLYSGMTPEQQKEFWEEKLKDGYYIVKVNVKFEAI